MYQVDSWHDLGDVLPDPSHYELEKTLNWSAGTLRVLQHASSLGLDRFTGWRCPDKPRFIDAGRVYKRGVAVNRVSEIPRTSSHYIYLLENPAGLAEYFTEDRFIVVDHNALPRLCGFAADGTGINPESISLVLNGVDEHGKNLDTVERLLKQWQEVGHHRKKWTVIGGGVVSDLCAFAASCVGARVDLLPTTLLAMIDAAIGGKTGINSPDGKNQIGSYYFPESVAICPYWLTSLPDDEILSGSWEAIKLALLAGDHQLLDRWLAEINNDPNDNWIELIGLTVEIKSKFVMIDPFEVHGWRQMLNLGHTLAHALEGVAMKKKKTTLRHGEAVGIGLIYSLILSKLTRKLSGAEDLFAKLLSHRGLLSKKQLADKLKVRKLDTPELWRKLSAAIMHDKKRRGKKVPWVFLQDEENKYGFHSGLMYFENRQVLRKCWQGLLTILD